jgi:hypothetical protein
MIYENFVLLNAASILIGTVNTDVLAAVLTLRGIPANCR